MDSETKTPAELKEIRIKRRQLQDEEGVKAMAEIAAADIAIRKRTENLRAARLAREEAERAKPTVSSVKSKAASKSAAKSAAKTAPKAKAKKSAS
jgi:hypothetical protein